MNRREFLVSTAGMAAAASAAGIVQGATAATDSQPAGAEATADRKRLVTYCGLYCGLCPWHGRIPQRAAALRESLRWDENEVPEPFRKVLAKLAAEPGKRCCREGTCGNTRHCPIRKCAMAKGVSACPFCSDYPCKRIAALGRNESTLIHDGQRLKEIGLEAWIAEQERRRQVGFCYADCLSWVDVDL